MNIVTDFLDTGQHQSREDKYFTRYSEPDEIIAVLSEAPLDRRDQVLLLCELITKKFVQARDIEQILGCSRSTALKYSSNLSKLGLITTTTKPGTEKKRRPTHLYSLAPSVSIEALKEVIERLEGVIDVQGTAGVQPQPLQSKDDLNQCQETPLQPLQQAEESPSLDMPSTIEPEYPATSSGASSTQSATVNKSNSSTFAELLISKFPEFNPSWSEDFQSKWLAAFEQLVKLGAEKSLNT